MKLFSCLIAVLAICALQNCAAPSNAAILTTPGGVAAPSACSTDGSAAAPAATIDFASLRSGYAATSPCAIADVDYGTGLPTGTSLADPTSAGLPSGWTYISGDHSISCSGTSNPGTVTGYDFSLHNGTGIEITNCTNVIIQRNKFQVASNCVFPINWISGTNITIDSNTVDGGGITAGQACAAIAGATSEMLYLQGNGTIHVYYNKLLNTNQHFVSYSGGTGVVDMRYNSETNCGWTQGPHCNGFQFVGGSYSGNIQDNLAYSPQPTTALEGSHTASFTSGASGNCPATPTNADCHITITDLPSVANANDNSMDRGMVISSTCVSAGTAVYSASTTGTVPTVSTNIVFENGHATSTNASCAWTIPLAYPSGNTINARITAQGGGVIHDLTYNRNTLIAVPGAVTTVSDNVYCNATGGGTVSNISLTTNYMDGSGAFGNWAVNGSDCSAATGSTWSGNINMNTGATDNPPW